jgi:hypothetical protein
MTPTQINAVWGKVVEDLLKFPETWQETETVDSIYASLQAGQLQLWCLTTEMQTLQMVLMTRINQEARGLVWQIVWAVGHNPQLSVLSIAAMEDVARAHGCYRLEVVGRKGWERVLRDSGYRWGYQVIVKDLDQMGGRQ